MAVVGGSLKHTRSLLLRDPRKPPRAHGGELDDHLSILRPDEVRCTLWLGEECARRIRRHPQLLCRQVSNGRP